MVRRYFDDYCIERLSINDEVRDLKIITDQDIQDTILALADGLSLPRDAKILDSGCGIGSIPIEFSKLGYRVIGVDLSPEMIKYATGSRTTVPARESDRKLPADGECKFRVGDAEDLDFESRSFDLIIASRLLEYVKWRRWVLQEIHRIIKPEGYLLIVAENRLSLRNLLNPGWYYSEIKAKLAAKFSKIARLKYPGKSKSKRERIRIKQSTIFQPQLASRIREDLKQVGFEVLLSGSQGFTPFPFLNRSKTVNGSSSSDGFSKPSVKYQSFHYELGKNLIFLCQKKKEPVEIKERAIFKDITESKSEFEADYRTYFKNRKNWMNNNPEFNPEKPVQIERVIDDRERILVISPHPDDEIIGCGGTLIKMLKQGRQVTVMHLLDGSKTSALADADEHIRHNARLREAEKVADFIGFSETIFWKIPDSELYINKKNTEKMQNVLGRLKPEIIFTPFVNDPHPDHQAANALLYAALSENEDDFRDIVIFGYECWSILPAGSFCVINSEFDKKKEALLKYKIAMRVVDYLHFCERLNGYHHITLSGEAGYAEAFFNIKTDRFIKLMEKQNVISGIRDE